MLFQIDKSHLDKRQAKVVDALIEASDSISSSSAHGTHSLADTLTRLPSVFQAYLYRLIRRIILIWRIEFDNDVFDPAYREIYEWAKEVDDVRPQ